MMSTIGAQPVLWVNVRSLVTSGPYANTNMQQWDQALVGACARYPNMRVYDWAHDVRDEWFIADGIHFTTPGYAARSRLIARALLAAFPAAGATAGQSCVVHVPRAAAVAARAVAQATAPATPPVATTTTPATAPATTPGA